jgi:transcriptional regulator with XRE-family HTH domain
MITNNPPSVCGETIRILRTLRGIKQTHAAKKLSITQKAYSKIELSRDISERKINQILKAFNCIWKDLENIIKITPTTSNSKINLHSFIF